jgi:hypothetical protein
LAADRAEQVRPVPTSTVPTLLTATRTTTALTPFIEARSFRRSTADQIALQARRARLLARYQVLRALHIQGISTRHMARQLQMSRATIIQYLRTDIFPERAQSRRVSLLDPLCSLSVKALGHRL